MNMSKTSIKCLLICLILPASMLSFLSCTRSDAYDYPVKPGMTEWKAFGSLDRMIEACQIPEDVLKAMSTEGLVETVLNYPLLTNMSAFNFTQDGFDSVYSYFNGLQELLSRQDAGTELMAKYLLMDPAAIQDDWTDIQKGGYAASFRDIEIIMAQKPILEKLTSAQRIGLLKDGLAKYKVKKENPVYGILGKEGSLWLIGRILQQEVAPSYIWNKPDHGAYTYYLDRGGLAENWIFEKIVEQAERYLEGK